MNTYIISIEGNLTSYVFYNDVLRELHQYYLKDGKSRIVFDFSKTKMIDPLVVPNLLCIAYIIKETSKYIPILHIPNSISTGGIKRYLNEINFLNLASRYELFDFDLSVFGGWSESGMDELNTTILFNQEEDERESWIKLVRYTRKFSNKYLTQYNDMDFQINLILELSREIIENSKIHGKSFCFMTIQYNYMREKVYLSYSDCGSGFQNSFYKKGCNVKSELEGIVRGIFTHYQKPYGLYSVINKTLPKGGTIRIHSNNTQLVLTQNQLLEMSVGNNAYSLNTILSSPKLQKNIRRNLKYAGVHIEIEIPLKREEIKNNV